MKTIGLCMIVKNESHVILRCLRSVRPLIDYVLIVDTGSTDGTQAIIGQYLSEAGLPGEVIDEPFRDFAYNRSFALAKLREKTDIDYALIMDADDILVFADGFDASMFKKTRTVMRHTGLAVSFSDVGEGERLSGLDVDVAAIDWDEIRRYARVAVQMLSRFADPTLLTISANAFIDGAIDEMRENEAPIAVPSSVVPIAAVETERRTTRNRRRLQGEEARA